MKTKVTSFLLLSFLSFSTVCNGQSLQTSDGVRHWEADFSAGLNNDGYQIDAGIAYFPIQYIGIKSQIGFAGELKAVEDWGRDEYQTGHKYALRIKFMPSVVLRSPRIFEWKEQESSFYLFTEPGMVFSPGARGSKGAKAVSWGVKSGITLQMDNVMIYFGYGISDFSLYSGRPYNQHGIPQKDNYITHSVFIGTAFKF